MQRTTSDAFDIKPSAFKGVWKDRDAFTLWLTNELDLAISARSGVASEIKYYWDYYEQNRLRANTAPWPDAADLPSPFAPEYTDALHARLMQTIFVEPVWTVEGFGPSAKRAPFVEEFHQKAQEDERLQSYVDEWVLRGLIEGVGTLEVSEAFETRREQVRKRVKLQLDPTTGQPLYGDKGPLLERNPETDAFVEVQDDPNVPSAEVDLDVVEPVRLGPEYDVIPYADFLVLPAHARTRKQIWGYAKRFWRRVPELQALASQGIYDADGVEQAGTDNDRVTQANEAPLQPSPVSQDGPTAQKECFEVQLLADLDGKGERWWRVTLQKERRALFRLKHDDRTTRYLRWMPFIRPGSMDRGYSLIQKIISTLEEDTARRNMTADRMAQVAGAPMKKLQGALWDEFEQPMGPRAVITVRDMREVEPMQMPDVPQSLFAWGTQIRQDADRQVGQNDVSQGQIAESNKTLGEVQLVASYAEVRMNLIIRRLQEPMEELGLARHNIWKRTLASNPDLPPQRALVIGRDAQGIDQPYVGADGTVTAEMLEGVFWFKPKGSVETADLNRQQQWFVQLMQALPALIQVSQPVGAIFQTVPAAKALVEQMLRVFRWPDRQSFIGSEANSVFDLLQQQQEMARDPRMQILMAMGGAAPGMGGPPQMGAGGPPSDPMAQQAPQGLM